jgi:hypothetical protein
MHGAINPHPPYAFMEWCSVKAQRQLCFALLYFTLLYFTLLYFTLLTVFPVFSSKPLRNFFRSFIIFACLLPYSFPFTSIILFLFSLPPFTVPQI